MLKLPDLPIGSPLGSTPCEVLTSGVSLTATRLIMGLDYLTMLPFDSWASIQQIIVSVGQLFVKLLNAMLAESAAKRLIKKKKKKKQ